MRGGSNQAPGSRLPAPGSRPDGEGSSTAEPSAVVPAGSSEPGAGSRERSERRQEPGASIAVFAGEPSGDLQGAALCEAMQREWSSAGRGALRFWGIGATRLRAAGAELIYDSSRWGAMGVAEALKLAPRLLLSLYRVRRELRTRRPELVILIDFGAFHVKVAAAAKELGLKVFYYFPPRSWSRHPRAVGRLPEVVDRVVTPFSWSQELLCAAGVDAHWVGHPLVDQARPTRDRTAFCAELGLKPQLPIVCYLPGSRGHEIRDIWPVMAGAARLLSERDPRIQHVVVRAPGVWKGVDSYQLSVDSYQLSVNSEDRHPAQRSTVNCQLSTAFTTTVHDALSACDVAVTKAGSVTLEVTLHERPMVVLYRGSWLQELEYRLWQRRRIKFIAMPNILADRPICPELIQREATPERIAALAWELLTEPEIREKQLRGLREVTEMLGPPGAVDRAAALALEMLKS